MYGQIFQSSRVPPNMKRLNPHALPRISLGEPVEHQFKTILVLPHFVVVSRNGKDISMAPGGR